MFGGCLWDFNFPLRSTKNKTLLQVAGCGACVVGHSIYTHTHTCVLNTSLANNLPKIARNRNCQAVRFSASNATAFGRGRRPIQLHYMREDVASTGPYGSPKLEPSKGVCRNSGEEQ